VVGDVDGQALFAELGCQHFLVDHVVLKEN
jgi:hypothetical protein